FQSPRLGLTVFPNGVVRLNNHDTDFGDVTLNAGHIGTGSGTLNLYGELKVLSASTPSVIEGQLHLPAPNIALFDVSDGTADPDLYINAKIDGGAPRLVKQGLGTMRFGLANNYIGLTQVDEGVLQIDTPDSLSPVSAGVLISFGGTLRSGGF